MNFDFGSIKKECSEPSGTEHGEPRRLQTRWGLPHLEPAILTVTTGTHTMRMRPRRMNRSPAKLRMAARACREMAAECVTEEARQAMLEIADSLDGEATAKLADSVRPVPLFNWTK